MMKKNFAILFLFFFIGAMMVSCKSKQKCAAYSSVEKNVIEEKVIVDNTQKNS